MGHSTAIYRRLRDPATGRLTAVRSSVDDAVPARVVVWPSSDRTLLIRRDPAAVAPRTLTEFWRVQQAAYRTRGLEAWAQACEQQIRALRTA